MSAVTGEQIRLVHGEQEVTVVEVGGGLRTYSAGGREILDGYGEDEVCPSGRGQLLVPWPNRIDGGVYAFEGRDHRLPLTEPEAGNAIHGLVRWSSWSVEERDAARAVVARILRPQPGYPFTLGLAFEYALDDDGLTVAATATNLGAETCPFGAGAHPYLAAGAGKVDALVLTLPAETVLRADARGIPTGSAPVAGTELDFREPRPIGATVLDHAFTGLARGDDGLARVDLHDADGGAVASLWADEAYPYLQVFTGDPLPDVARRSIAVEPMTSAERVRDRRGGRPPRARRALDGHLGDPARVTRPASPGPAGRK
jgi:aldose 1-epimerase